MEKISPKILVTIISLLTIKSISARNWSYLYCVSNSSIAVSAYDNYCSGGLIFQKCISTNWAYAKEDNTNELALYANFLGNYSGGIYIYSKGIVRYTSENKFNVGLGMDTKYMYVKTSHEYSIVDHTFQNEAEALAFCSKIEEKCKNDNLKKGNNYSAVGYGGEAQPWRGIQAEYLGGYVQCKSSFPKYYTTTWEED
nr:hypothetical protein GTC16762_16750 [Pigmentibacter ruber]